jgi:hypothetical protein
VIIHCHRCCQRYNSEGGGTLFGFFMVLETFLRSPRVHPFYNPTLAEWRPPSRMTRQTSISFKDSLEHPLEDAAWRLPHAARARQITTTNESGATPQFVIVVCCVCSQCTDCGPHNTSFVLPLCGSCMCIVSGEWSYDGPCMWFC